MKSHNRLVESMPAAQYCRFVKPPLEEGNWIQTSYWTGARKIIRIPCAESTDTHITVEDENGDSFPCYSLTVNTKKVDKIHSMYDFAKKGIEASFEVQELAKGGKFVDQENVVSKLICICVASIILKNYGEADCMCQEAQEDRHGGELNDKYYPIRPQSACSSRESAGHASMCARSHASGIAGIHFRWVYPR